MAAGSTYTPIATTTLGSNTASYTFSSIPSTYTDLILVYVGQSLQSSDQNLNLQFNSDTSGGNYSYTRLLGTGSVAASGRGSNLNSMQVGLTSSDGQSNCIFQIQNYANTTTYKTALARANTPALVEAGVGLWRSTSAINSVTIRADASDVNNRLTAGTVITLYGIAAA